MSNDEVLAMIIFNATCTQGKCDTVQKTAVSRIEALIALLKTN